MTRSAPDGDGLFFGMVAAYCVIYIAFYPASYSISDESCIIALARAISHGTVFLDSPLWGLTIGDRIISKYSAFHAAMLTPLMLVSWRAMFLLGAAAFLAGAFIIRAMLRRVGIASGWCFLYFMLAGALFYSQTVLAAVPAAVAGLFGASLCLRDEPRPFAAGLALGAATLIHPWTGPFAVVFTFVWSAEQGARRVSSFLSMLSGALPALIALMAYNHATTGSAFRDAYTILGHQYSFGGDHLAGFLPFYFFSLAIFPIAGWAAFSRRWSGTWAIPAVCAVTIAMASLYYYRDGLNVGSARNTFAALLAGFIPGQRFLLPASMLACLPAARLLNSRTDLLSRGAGKIAAFAVFVVSFLLLTIAHQSYLDAHAKVQRTLADKLPADAKVASSGDATKEFAPTRSVFTGAYELETSDALPGDQYFALLETPGGDPPPDWAANHTVSRIPIRSWAWNRDLLIGAPTSGGKQQQRSDNHQGH
ncbi:MAG TPA: hypothetical protein VMA09_22785 [Candidatus Binataceae bacterium]|nr:hypothetical protein [Candidatus Binataceae bacterium]